MLAKRITVVLLIALTILDLFYFFHKITPFTPKEFVYPKVAVFDKLAEIQGIDRFWGYGSASIDTELNLPYKLYYPEGYDPLFIKRYGEFVATAKNGKIPTVIPRTDVNIPPGYGPDDLKNNYHRQRILNLLGVKYILHKRDIEIAKQDEATFPPDRYSLVYHQGSYQIYENKNVVPRIFLASRIIVKERKQEIINTLFDKNIDLRKTIVLEEQLDKEMLLEDDKDAKAKLISYTPNEIKINTHSTKNQILFLSDNYFPGWKAFVDGKEQKIYRADYTFRAVPIEKGNHTVIFSYYPESFYWGTKISLIAVGILLIGTFLLKKKIV